MGLPSLRDPKPTFLRIVSSENSRKYFLAEVCAAALWALALPNWLGANVANKRRNGTVIESQPDLQAFPGGKC